MSTQAAPDRTLFDDADELELRVPTSCRRSGRCRECIVEVAAGAEFLACRTEPELFLRDPYRLACQAAVVDPHARIDFSILRRRLRILVPDVDDEPEPADAVVRIIDGNVYHREQLVEPLRGGIYGVAVDLGTTTIVAELVDLAAGRTVAVGALENPQRFGGSDIMNRISYDGSDGTGQLRRAARRALNRKLDELYATSGIDRREVYEAVVVGNSTMRDLFFGLDVSPIGERPYKSLTEHELHSGTRETTSLKAHAYELAFRSHPHASIWGAPLIASHVGADMAADLVALGVDDETDETVMIVDIGTNTEVALAVPGRLAVASCPAGPAFEGGLVEYGMQGVDGAIESIRRENDGSFTCRTIGGMQPQGICGSGLIDLLAELRRSELMTPLGVFADGASLLTVDEEAGITFSRADGSALAQAKAANTAGQWIVMRHLGIDPADVERLYLVGGFANYVDVENAIDIGFLPPVPPERVVKVGNASVRGARRLLLSETARMWLEALVLRIQHIELETTPDFFDIFVEGCQFKPMPDQLRSADGQVVL
ncbi:MAG: ASKHA domain-containing protein [Actinomycetia bacterium]|nr:ASKHA domain-containing protein [Actinomycetes bacterium]